jgi:hypothetical protein
VLCGVNNTSKEASSVGDLICAVKNYKADQSSELQMRKFIDIHVPKQKQAELMVS